MAAEQSYPASGLVIAVAPESRTLTVSHGKIAGYMDAMTMPFHVRGVFPEALKRGDAVTFRLHVEKNASWIGEIGVVAFESAERDPVAARRLSVLDAATGERTTSLATAERVPDFHLIDQNSRPVSLSQFRGKVVALDFIYTRCPLPDYCFRLSNNFARLQKRFRGRHDLALLTITFDPLHDTPQALANYAKVWNADTSLWRFLTGEPAEVQLVCSLFGVAYWQDEGLFTHTLHTVLIGADGKLAANVEGNKFSAQQLGDLVEDLLHRGK